MKHLSKILLLCWVLLISSLKIIAQNYPVQCTPIVSPPYSLSWTDYATSTEKFKVYLLLKDLEKPSVEVTIRIRLKGLGVVLENIPDFVSTKPIVLQPGIPQILSGAQLSDNFSADNLVAQGITLEELYQGTNLPAGFYQWEVTAYLPDQRQVSNTGVTLMTVFRAQPPTITYPANNAILPNTGFQSINFTWVSNSYYSVNTAQGTLYRLRLYEIPEEDEDTDPNVVINAGILPVFMTEVLATNYLYSSSDPVLTPGKRYALQVQAMDVNGYDQFENNGFSQVVAFTYGTQGQLATQRCLRPQEVSIEPVGDAGVVVSWTNPNAEVLDYTLSYRKTTDDQWIEKQTSESSYTLLQLPASSYEFKVLARCSYVSKSSFSQPQGYIIKQEPIDSTMQINPPSNTIDEDTDYTSETYTVSDSNPSQQYPPAVYQAETPSSTTIDILNKPIRIVYETSSLPDSLKKSLPSGGALPQLSSNATVEELKTALNTSKIDCASYLAGYSCGQHDAPSVPSGDIIQVKTGDEIAINSIAFEVVDLDGSGNGKGIVKVPMFNNAKLGIDFKNIKVAKGGCVVAGQAELSHIDVALLSEEQRRKLVEIYAAYNLALTVADSLAPEIAKTYNSIADLLKDVRAKAKAVIEKLDKNEKPTTQELKNLTKLSETAIAAKKKELAVLKKQVGADTSKYVTSLDTWLVKQDSALACAKTLPTTPTPKKGGPFLDENGYLGDCDISALTEEEPVNYIKSVELDPHYVENINKEQQVYSCNCGWIDLNHAFTITGRSDAKELGLGANNLWDQILYETGEKSDNNVNGFKVKYSQDVKYGISIGIHREYFVKYGLSKEVKKQVALAIFQEVSMAYESMQQVNIFSSSSYEPSDLVSNLLSFYYFVEEGFTKEKIFTLCGKKSKEESLAIYKMYPGTFTDEQFKNKKFTPKFFPNKFCSSMIFPKEFQKIKPAIKGNDFFRDWTDFDDKPKR